MSKNQKWLTSIIMIVIVIISIMFLIILNNIDPISEIVDSIEKPIVDTTQFQETDDRCGMWIIKNIDSTEVNEICIWKTKASNLLYQYITIEYLDSIKPTYSIDDTIKFFNNKK